MTRRNSAARDADDHRSKSSGAAGDPESRPARRGLRALEGHERAVEPDRIDGLIHQRVRLGIVSALAVSEPLSFNELKQVLNATDGNLSVHARKLEDAGYVECSKRFEDRVPRTEYRLTKAGRRALTRYLDHMSALIEATRGV